MKYIKVLLLFTAINFVSCDESDRSFTGYIVHKEYIPQHYDDETPEEVSCAGVIIPPRPVMRPPRKPVLVKSRWIWYVANKNSVKAFEKDSLSFNDCFCGDKLTIQY